MPRLYAAIALLALALYAWAAIGQSRIGALDPSDEPRAYPATVDGRAVASAEEARFVTGRVTPGAVVRVDDRLATARRAIPPVSQAIAILVAFAFAAACLFAFAGRAGTEPARTFFWGSFGYGLAVAAGGVHLGAILASLLRIASTVLTPLLLVRVAFVFPRRASWPSARALAWVLPLAGLVVAFVYGGAFLAYARGNGSFVQLEGAQRVAFAWIVLVTVSGAYLVWRNSRTAELARERRQAKWVAWGVGVGMMPFVLLYVLPRAFGAVPIASLDVVRLCALAVPTAFAIAVIRHQFMDIDVIIRRSLIYAALAAMLTAIYLALGLFLGGRFGVPGGPSAETRKLLAAGLAALLFFPTQKAIGAWVDHTFFRIRTSHERAARDFRRMIAGVADPDEWAHVLVAFARDALGLTRAVVVHSGGRAAWLPAAPTSAPRAERTLSELEGAEPIAAPHRTGLPELEHDDFPRALLDAGLVVARPLAGSAALALGEKETERRFIEQDFALLEAVSLEADAALERILLVRHAAEEEARVRQNEELDRKKSEFLSQVAHDLGTPLTSILWSSQNLIDGIGDVPASASSIRAAALHLSRLSANLSAIAHLDDGAFRPRPEPLALAPLLAEARLALEPLAGSHGVTLAMESCEDGWPRVGADREGLMKVVINVLDNAIKHAPRGSSVTLRMVRSPGRQGFAVVDHGPGVADRDKAKIFERYVRGSDGNGKGFGLGLFVARQQLEGVAGTIEVTDTPGGGATFTCTLKEEGSWPAS